MDTFTFMFALLIILLALQYNAIWIIFAVLALLVVSMRSLSTIFLVIITIVVLFFLRGANITEYWPIVVIGLIIISMLLGTVKKQPEQEPMGMDMFGGMGGMEGLGGMM